MCRNQSRNPASFLHNPDRTHTWLAPIRRIQPTVHNIPRPKDRFHTFRDPVRLPMLPQGLGKNLPSFGAETEPAEELRFPRAVRMRGTQQVLNDLASLDLGFSGVRQSHAPTLASSGLRIKRQISHTIRPPSYACNCAQNRSLINTSWPDISSLSPFCEKVRGHRHQPQSLPRKSPGEKVVKSP